MPSTLDLRAEERGVMFPATSFNGVFSSCLAAGGCLMRGVTLGGSDLTEGGRLTAVPVVEGVDGVARRSV